MKKPLNLVEKVEAADVHECEMQFLYNDGTNFHFMEPKSYEQHELTAAVVGDTALWLKEQDMCTVTLWNGAALIIEPPKFCLSSNYRNRSGCERRYFRRGGIKPATLETGAVVKVPLFVQEGEIIKIDTRNGEYVSRVK